MIGTTALANYEDLEYRVEVTHLISTVVLNYTTNPIQLIQYRAFHIRKQDMQKLGFLALVFNFSHESSCLKHRCSHTNF